MNVRRKFGGWTSVVVLAFGWASGCQVGLAQEEEAPAVTATAADTPVSSDSRSDDRRGEIPAPVRMHTDQQVMGSDRWENALDAKFTDLYSRKASEVDSPTVMLTALWNRKFRYNTYLGITVSGLPQSHAEKKDGIKTSYTMYYGGLNLAQGLYESKPLRAVVQVSGGKGQAYRRLKGEGVDNKAKTYKFSYVEPALVVMFYEWKHLEMGLIGSNRMVKLEGKADIEDKEVTDEALSSTSYGLTFRTERW